MLFKNQKFFTRVIHRDSFSNSRAQKFSLTVRGSFYLEPETFFVQNKSPEGKEEKA
jgi:hypothetical protein